MPRNRRTTKQQFRRLIAIIIGLCLGWMAADVAFDQVPSAAYGSAAPASGEKGAEPAGEHDQTVEALKIGKSSWFNKVIAGAVLLFVAAAVLGPFVLSLKGPDPVERDEAHSHDAHDAHAAPGHGHGDKPHAPAAHGH